MRYFFVIYCMTLLIYIAYNILYIDSKHTFPKKLKIIMTAGCMVFVFIALIIAFHTDGIPIWKVILVGPLCIVFWASAVDAFIGLGIHGDPFYMSPNTWPDEQLLRIVQNGHLYALFKLILLMIFGGLIYYL